MGATMAQQPDDRVYTVNAYVRNAQNDLLLVKRVRVTNKVRVITAENCKTLGVRVLPHAEAIKLKFVLRSKVEGD